MMGSNKSHKQKKKRTISYEKLKTILLSAYSVFAVLVIAATSIGIVFVCKNPTQNASAESVYTITSYDSDSDDNSDSETHNSSDYSSSHYGNKSTKCAKAGCNNYIASSGDTAYCTTHSNRCLNCNSYIDGDAVYCMDCLKKSVSNNKNKYSYNSKNSRSYTSSKYSNDKNGFVGSDGKYHRYIPQFGDGVNNWMKENW